MKNLECPAVILRDKARIKPRLLKGQGGDADRLILEVNGIAETVVEIIQQAAWILTALSPPSSSTLNICKPVITGERADMMEDQKKDSMRGLPSR